VSGAIWYKIRVICAVVLASLLLIVLTGLTVVWAETDNSNWSWSGAKPIVFSSTPTAISYYDINWCNSFMQDRQVAGRWGAEKICMFSEGEKIRFGMFQSGSSFLPVVSFKYDEKMYRFNGLCDRYDECLYLPDSDMFVTKQRVSQLTWSLVVYRNFSQRLVKIIDPSKMAVEYNFDYSNPDYVFRSAGGQPWAIGGWGVSSNGQWLAVEFKEKGIGLLDMSNFQMKRISTVLFHYGVGRDPISELSVSNDGKRVAVMGINAGLSVYDVVSDCGEIANDTSMSYADYMAHPCKKSSINTNEFISRFWMALRPRLNDDGGELSFYAISYSSGSREVSLRAKDYTSQRIDYLALGDSFSSGEGETDDKYYREGTNDEYEKCHISTRSYPFLITDLMKLDSNYMASVACSGAMIGDVIGDDISYLGQGDRLGENYMKLNDTDMVLARSEAKDNFIPGRVYQEEFVEKYSPKSITVGIGGNDVGFADKLKSCLGADTCNWAGSQEDREQTAIEIKNLFNKLVQTYQKLHEASPSSKIYVIGYPKIIDETGKCGLINGYMLDATEREFINEGVVYLNQVVSAAAQAAGVEYIDIQESYGNHVLCGSEKPVAVNAIRFGDDIALINQLPEFRQIGSESFHPNPIGHGYAADAIINDVSNLLDHNHCSNGQIICPDNTIEAPEPSSYWLPEQYHDYPTQKIAKFVFDRVDTTDNRQKKLTVVSGSLAPNSSVRVEMTSDVVRLGDFVTASDGSLNVDVDLPADVEEGYHTIHLYGTSYSGESIEFYQVIGYFKPHKISIDLFQSVADSINVGKKGHDDNDVKITYPLNQTLGSDSRVETKVVNEDTDTGVQRSELVLEPSRREVKGAAVVSNRSASLVQKTNDNKQNGALAYIIVGIIAVVSGIGAVIVKALYGTRE
jgi:lysophospholipase L1-like esterase